MSDCGFEPARVRKWLATPIGAKVTDPNPAYQRAADVVLEAMTAAGADPLTRLNVLVKVMAMVIGTWGLGNTGDPPDDSELQALCENLGVVTWAEASDFLKKLRGDIRRSRDA